MIPPASSSTESRSERPRIRPPEESFAEGEFAGTFFSVVTVVGSMRYPDPEFVRRFKGRAALPADDGRAIAAGQGICYFARALRAIKPGGWESDFEASGSFGVMRIGNVA